ncbi:MAG: pyridoxal phosphate-dependent aminotransferase [Candidatus Bathyarchaeota archaeon]|nr:MAG: pyridoxal phosphate-dependent aminotransferase [Candidatus Bathyarchaeota archaeon]
MTDTILPLSFSDRVLELKAAKTFEYSDLASKLVHEGKELISFGIGQPDFQTPKHIVDAAVTALKTGFTRYVSPPGIPELRAAIATSVSAFTGAGDVKPEETLVTAGAKHAMFFTIVSCIKPGDEVILPDPAFYSYAHVIRYAGGKPVFVPLNEDSGFTMTPADVQAKITGKTRMIIVNSPHNPTGSVLKPHDFQGILTLAKERKILIASDEVYDHFTYTNDFKSALNDPDWRDYVIYVNSFSKTYAMTGWRLGYVVAQAPIIRRLTLFTANTVSCTTSFVQKAGVAALCGSQKFFSKVLHEYKVRRDFIHQELNRIHGVKAEKPTGAFYIFPNVKDILQKTQTSTEELAINLMKKNGVVVLPGTAFPHEAGIGYLRMSYALPREKIEQGLVLFKSFINQHM